MKNSNILNHLITNAYKTVAWLVNRERFGEYVAESDILSVENHNGDKKYLIGMQDDKLNLVTSLSLSGFEPKTVSKCSDKVTTVDTSLQGAGVQGYKINKESLLTVLTNAFVEQPVIKLAKHAEMPWLHTKVINDTLVSYCWDTREINDIEVITEPIVLDEDFHFVPDDLNTPIHIPAENIAKFCPTAIHKLKHNMDNPEVSKILTVNDIEVSMYEIVSDEVSEMAKQEYLKYEFANN
jgi:hypothetical protein